jgi:hypothetical protein
MGLVEVRRWVIGHDALHLLGCEGRARDGDELVEAVAVGVGLPESDALAGILLLDRGRHYS